MSPNLVEKYAEHAIEHGAATIAGDSKAGNAAYEKLIVVYKQLLKNNDHSFQQLLNHPNESVRMWSAVHMLPFNPTIARDVLEELSKRQGIVAFNSLITLKEYDKGTLKIDGYHINKD